MEMSVLAGVHCVSKISCSQKKNFVHLRRAIDLARVARDPRRCHGLLRNRLEMLRAYPDVLQAARQSEAADEAVQHVGGVLARLSPRLGHQPLPPRLAFFLATPP